MKMGEYIKHLRKGNNVHHRRWTQDELGALLDPPVNRSGVNKWEKGRVENLKRTHILQLANIFGVHPCELMCFDADFDSEQIAEDVKLIEQIQKTFGSEVVELLQYFMELNDVGKRKVIEDVIDLSELPKYQK